VWGTVPGMEGVWHGLHAHVYVCGVAWGTVPGIKGVWHDLHAHVYVCGVAWGTVPGMEGVWHGLHAHVYVCGVAWGTVPGMKAMAVVASHHITPFFEDFSAAQPFLLQQVNNQLVHDFLSQQNNRLFLFLSELMDLFVAGRDQSAAD